MTLPSVEGQPELAWAFTIRLIPTKLKLNPMMIKKEVTTLIITDLVRGDIPDPEPDDGSPSPASGNCFFILARIPAASTASADVAMKGQRYLLEALAKLRTEYTDLQGPDEDPQEKATLRTS